MEMAARGRTHGSRFLSGVLDGPAVHITFVCGGTVPVSRDRSVSQPIESRARLPRFQLRELVDGMSHTLVLSGELDRASAAELEAKVLSVCKNAIYLLVLDLRKLTLIDLYGVRMVLFAKEVCAWRGCDFGLVPGPGNVQRVFEPSNRPDVPATSIPGGKALLSWSAPAV
jgi:anti-anti-sigma factor